MSVTSAPIVHQLPPDVPARPDEPPGEISIPPELAARVRLVAPGAVPDGAVVLGHVIALPAPADTPAQAFTAVGDHAAGSPAAGATVRQLVAVPTSASSSTAPGALPERPTDGLLLAAPGLVVDRRGRRVTDSGLEVELTRREFELLEYLITHPGHVLTRQQLLSTVWRRPDRRTTPPRTVDVHVSRLRRKLGPHAGLLRSLRGVGYCWSGHTERVGATS